MAKLICVLCFVLVFNFPFIEWNSSNEKPHKMVEKECNHFQNFWKQRPTKLSKWKTNLRWFQLTSYENDDFYKN